VTQPWRASQLILFLTEIGKTYAVRSLTICSALLKLPAVLACLKAEDRRIIPSNALRLAKVPA